MADKPWHFLINSIKVVTEKSYRAMRLIGNFTLAALNVPDDTFLIGLHDDLEPFVTAFLNAYALWLAQLGTQMGSTNTLYIELELLGSTDIKIWELAIQQVNIKGSDGYKKLLPRFKRPFQQGGQEDKISAVEALSLALDGIVPLEAVKVLVDAKLVKLNSFNSTKNTGKSTRKVYGNDVESTRKDLADNLYGTLGELMSHYRTNPKLIKSFFHIQAIRRFEQTIWRRKLKGFALEYIFTRTLLETDEIKLVNKSLNTIRYSMVENKNSAIGAVFYDLLPNTNVVVKRPLFGPLANHCMVVQNLGTGVANYMLVIV